MLLKFIFDQTQNIIEMHNKKDKTCTSETKVHGSCHEHIK